MAIAKYLDPKNDIAFKKIFGTEKNKDILLHFLNDSLNFSEDQSIWKYFKTKNLKSA